MILPVGLGAGRATFEFVGWGERRMRTPTIELSHACWGSLRSPQPTTWAAFVGRNERSELRRMKLDPRIPARYATIRATFLYGLSNIVFHRRDAEKGELKSLGFLRASAPPR